MLKSIPVVLKKHLLPFNWEVEKVWLLPCQTQTAPIGQLSYLLDLPFWSSRPNAGMLFDLTPNQALNNILKYSHQAQRIKHASTQSPLDFITQDGRLYILDGLHRLAKLAHEGRDVVTFRCHDARVRVMIESPVN